MAESEVAKIECQPEDPMELWTEWFEEATNCCCSLPNVLSFATSTKNGDVSCRTVVMRRKDPDGFVIVTDNRGRKARDLEENPKAAVTFLWSYVKGNSTVFRQVRMEGEVQKLTPDEFVDIYNREPIYCKIRAHVCHQDKQNTWQELREKHEEVYEQYKNGTNSLEMPDHYIGYKFLPKMADFYHARENQIADRVRYDKEEEGFWRNVHIFA